MRAPLGDGMMPVATTLAVLQMPINVFEHELGTNGKSLRPKLVAVLRPDGARVPITSEMLDTSRLGLQVLRDLDSTHLREIQEIRQRTRSRRRHGREQTSVQTHLRCRSELVEAAGDLEGLPIRRGRNARPTLATTSAEIRTRLALSDRHARRRPPPLIGRRRRHKQDTPCTKFGVNNNDGDEEGDEGDDDGKDDNEGDDDGEDD
ncbi:MAG: hypothetical protein M1826_002359 [Phylliscum demangeonii]|nr:MAG: hypothetical protein M1826_002359 [Phylliscum demangeonii]